MESEPNPQPKDYRVYTCLRPEFIGSLSCGIPASDVAICQRHFMQHNIILMALLGTRYVELWEVAPPLCAIVEFSLTTRKTCCQAPLTFICEITQYQN